MSRTISFAIVGFGHIGRKHATMINQNPQASLVAIVDTDPGSQDDPSFPAGITFYNSLEELLNDSTKKDIDVISICTPNGYHAPQAIAALRKRHHVLIEKPMALSRADCEEILIHAMHEDRQVFVVKQNRYSPPSKWLKQIVHDGTLGKIHLVQINCYWNRDDRYYTKGSWRGTNQHDGGTLFTQFSHFIDLLYWIFGDVHRIHASFTNANHQHSIDFEDSGLVQFELVRGGMGSLNYSTAVYDKNLESSITVIGENGSVKVGGQYMNEVLYCHIKDYEMPVLEETNPPNDYGPFKGSAANHHYVIDNIVATLNGQAHIGANALEGMKTVDIIERIYQQRK